MAWRRNDRVAGFLQREVGRILHTHIRDPRLSKLVTVSGVTVSPDLSRATIGVTVLGDQREADEAMHGLDSAVGFLRREVAQRMRLKRAPELRFVHDISIERGNRVLDLLDALNAKEKPQ